MTSRPAVTTGAGTTAGAALVGLFAGPGAALTILGGMTGLATVGGRCTTRPGGVVAAGMGVATRGVLVGAMGEAAVEATAFTGTETREEVGTTGVAAAAAAAATAVSCATRVPAAAGGITAPSPSLMARTGRVVVTARGPGEGLASPWSSDRCTEEGVPGVLVATGADLVVWVTLL